MNLNSVRIRFEAFMLCEQQQPEVELETKQFFLRPLCAPVYSKPIANQSKLNENFFFHELIHTLSFGIESPDSGELRIVRLNRFYGSVIGGDEIYLLCEKVNKKEIRIRFFEIDNDGNQQWESFGQFNESDVHHQVAIVFRTPPYRNVEITKPIQVYIQLFRQRDGESSEPRTFIYKPQDESISNDSLDIDDHNLLKQIKMENQSGKRRKYCPNINQQQQHNNKNRKQQQQNENLDNEQVIKVKKEELDNNNDHHDDDDNQKTTMTTTMNTDNYTSHHQHHQLPPQQQQQQQQLPPMINQNIDHYTSINHQCG